MKPKTFCLHYHIDCHDDTDIHQCWRVINETNIIDPEKIYHPGCEGDERRCDYLVREVKP